VVVVAGVEGADALTLQDLILTLSEARCAASSFRVLYPK